MRRFPATKKASDGPSACGGSSLWPWLALAVLVTVVMVHLARPVAPVKTSPAPQTTAVAQAIAVSEPPPPIVFENPQASRFSVFMHTLADQTDLPLREQMIAAWLAGVKAGEIPDLLELLQSATPTELAQDLSRRLIRQWTADKPEAAAAWIEMLPPEIQTAMISDVAIVWANHQPTNALAWAAALPDNAARNLALAAIAGETIRSEPMLALQVALDLPPNAQRDDLICRGAMQWASADAGKASEWAVQIPKGDLRDRTVSGIATVWSASEPVLAANFALKELPPGRQLDDTVISILQRWAQREPDAAMAWAEQFPAGPLRDTAVENVLAQSPQPAEAMNNESSN